MKGKSRTHNTRMDLLRCDAANARRRARKQAAYDKRQIRHAMWRGELSDDPTIYAQAR